MPAPELTNVERLADELRDSVSRSHRRRRMLGIVGAPGSGKSTLAEELAARLGSELCCVVPMDGFHLANSIIDGTPMRLRKGAIDTFDAGGYASLLGRLKARTEDVVYARYQRGLEEPIAAAIAVPHSVRSSSPEGNYILASISPWKGARETLDETWFIDTAREIRLRRLIDRHVKLGIDGRRRRNGRTVRMTPMRASSRGQSRLPIACSFCSR